ncbi:unnamed protein product [Caretta caretta]
MPTNKSPGMDGLTVEFYRAFWDVLGPDLVTVWAESLQGGVLPLSCSTDYKVVAKAISLRLGSVLADVIHPDQTYTVPGLTIFDNLYLVRVLLDLGCRDGLSFALLSLDQEKAFDRVDHGYLLVTLRAFGLGPQFVGFLQVLYASAECLVRLNWTLTEPVSFGRGVRRLTGLALREPELRLVLSAYADDVLLVVQDPGDLARVEACQAVYSAASSAQVNWVKSSGLVVEAHWSRHSRLDRIYLSRFHLSRAHSSSIRLAPFSDHHLATAMDSLCVERPGPAYWHFNNSLLEDVGFLASFQEFWLARQGQRHAFPSAWRWWDLGKVRAWLFCCDFTQGISRRRDAAIEQLEWEVLELERHLAANPEDPPLCGACREKWEELWAFKEHRSLGTFVRSRISLLREMDRGSRFFYALEKRRGAKKHVTCLLTEDGTPLIDPVEMRAVLTLLLKKEDLCDLQNWRPVSLLSTDYKVIAKAISLWLRSMLADVVRPDQTYTVPGRSILHNLYLVRDLLELGYRDGLSFTLLSLDQEKVFNRVDHGYVLSTLRAFGFGPQFVGFLRVLYASAECLVRLNWTLAISVSFRRGVWQGCPLSGQLYALAIEPFLCLLHWRLMGLVLWEPELWLVLSAYADNMLLVVQDPGDLAWVEACQAICSADSSALVNWVKSSGLVVGDSWQASSLPPALQAIRWSAGLLLYLGIYLSATHPSLWRTGTI